MRETLKRLRSDIAALRASRERLVLAADADCRRIERELHDGVQQHLIALAVNIQLAESLAGSDSGVAKTLLQEMRRDVQQAIDQAARLAERIYTPLLEMGSLAPALRAAAVSAGTPASVEVSADSSYPPEIVRTIHLCWLEALDRGGSETGVSISVRESDGALLFEVVADGTRSDAGSESLRDRVEALGGELTSQPVAGGGVRLVGSFRSRADASRSQPGRGSPP